METTLMTITSFEGLVDTTLPMKQVILLRSSRYS
jgi:hypothetical protein